MQFQFQSNFSFFITKICMEKHFDVFFFVCNQFNCKTSNPSHTEHQLDEIELKIWNLLPQFVCMDVKCASLLFFDIISISREILDFLCLEMRFDVWMESASAQHTLDFRFKNWNNAANAKFKTFHVKFRKHQLCLKCIWWQSQQYLP